VLDRLPLLHAEAGSGAARARAAPDLLPRPEGGHGEAATPLLLLSLLYPPRRGEEEGGLFCDLLEVAHGGLLVLPRTILLCSLTVGTALGAGVSQDDPKHCNEWLFDWIQSGWFAEAAMQGFVEAPKYGAYNI